MPTPPPTPPGMRVRTGRFTMPQARRSVPNVPRQGCGCGECRRRFEPLALRLPELTARREVESQLTGFLPHAVSELAVRALWHCVRPFPGNSRVLWPLLTSADPSRTVSDPVA